jgi:hypothetical protein
MLLDKMVSGFSVQVSGIKGVKFLCETSSSFFYDQAGRSEARGPG